MLLIIVAAIYFIPTVIATKRKTVNRGSVSVINLLLGWTFIGWVVALAMAYGRTEAQEMRMHAAQGQMGQWPPGWYPDPGDPSFIRWWDGRQWNMTPDGRRQG